MSDTLTPRERDEQLTEYCIKLYAGMYLCASEEIRALYRNNAIVFKRINLLRSAFESTAQQEREECAKVAENTEQGYSSDPEWIVAVECNNSIASAIRARSTPPVSSGKDKNYYAIKSALDSFWENATPEQIAKLIEVAENECGLHVDPPVTDNKEASV